ncbi:acyl-CoA thioesterase [Brevibacillus marinus]|uniref:acyl-CoA thioesterase n=1 Tax=Brevibacillus marinus TaxID=2496837 RepID=UPI000F848D78|nr:thioesterase family protein [Brevibacillus marinus]
MVLHLCDLRTRFCESDALGHINSVSFLIYLEQARVAFLLDSDVIPDIAAWPFVLAAVRCDYKRQLSINQSILIQTFVKAIGRKSFTLQHDILDGQTQELLACGESVIVHYDFAEKASRPLPHDMRAKLDPYRQRS